MFAYGVRAERWGCFLGLEGNSIILLQPIKKYSPLKSTSEVSRLFNKIKIIIWLEDINLIKREAWVFKII